MSADDDQRRRARLATISALLVVASFLAAKAARDATLLARFPIKSLPLFIGISAALSLPIIILAGKLMVRFGPMRLVPAMNALSGLVALAEWVLISRYPRPIAVVTFFHLNIASAVLVSGFWSIVNERFDIASAKRHIGRIGMGATFGGILGGVIAERTAVYLAPDAILGVLAGMQLVCAVILYAFGRGHVATEQPLDHEAMSTWRAMGGVVRSSLLRKAGIVVVMTAVGAGALDYVFKADIVGHNTHTDLLAQLAVFYTVTNIATAIFQVALTGPTLTLLGVPRSVATLPYMLTGFSVLSLIIPLPVTATLARGAELVTRNSIYRAGYELLYAPLPTEQKRPTKVVLDVGADKIGDILSAQLVGAVVFMVAAPRTGLLVTAGIAGAVAIFFTLRLPRAYTESLEASLLEAVAEHSRPVATGSAGAQPEPWVSLTEMPAFGHPADVVPLQMSWRRKKLDRQQPKVTSITPPHGELVHDELEHLVNLTRTFRGSDAAAITAALAQHLPYEILPMVLDLVANDDDEIAKAAILGLRKLAPLGTGLYVEALTDREAPEKLRRRMPGLLTTGAPGLAGWGLWRGLADPSFDVRYYCSTALAGLQHELSLRNDDVFEYVRKELLTDPNEWRARKLATDPVIEATGDSSLGLSHIFRVLGLVLPAEPLRVALHAMQTDDASLRGMALEYLESILPPDVRAQLWPFLDEHAVPNAEAVVDTAAAESLIDRLRAATSGEYPKLPKPN
ncbi:hypothetical protein BH11MYX1_BH11MYX1_04680 [soil metagenome]